MGKFYEPHYSGNKAGRGVVSLLLLMVLGFACIIHNANGQTLFSGHGPFQEPVVTDSRDAADLLPPVITYAPLTDICTTGNRTLTATITDIDGVPTSGSGLPVLYFRINSGPWTPVTGTSIGANQYTFTFGGAAVQGSIVSYYIVAQDNAATPNVGAQPSAGAAGFTADPPAASTAPTTPSFYVIQPTLAAGTYLVGPGQTYLTITDAVNAYNNSCLAGPVVFALTDPSGYGPSEVFPITIFNPAASATNTLTIRPNTGINTTITGSSPEALFRLYGADFVTIDGSSSASNTRNLTLTNTNTSSFASTIWIGSQSTSNGATNNIIRNCNISGNSGILAGSTTFAGIISCSGANIGFPSEAPNSNNIIRNNAFFRTTIGIYLIGPTGSTDAGNIIDRNTVGSSSAPAHIGYRGIWANNQSNLNINTNTVFNVTSSFGTGSDTDPTSGIIINGNTINAEIHANTINTIRNINVAGWQSFGICLQSSSATSNTRVYNNMIYAVTGNGRATDAYQNGHGIGVLTGGGYGIYFNSVHLIINQVQTGITSAIYIGSGITGIGVLDIRNNIFSNRQTTGSRYCVYSMAPNTAFSNIDYNCYFTSQRIGFLISNQNNLAAWQAATTRDNNSTATDPNFQANNNLRLQPFSSMNNVGVPISGITTDIDGSDIRNPATPDIGCDEIFPPACTGNTPGTVSASRTTLCYGGSVLLSSTGFAFGLGISYQWESSTDNISFTVITGETNPTSGTPPAITQTTYYRLRVSCSGTGGVPAYSNVVTVTVQTPSITGTTPGVRCGQGTVNLSATGSSGTVVNWYSTPTGGEPLATGNNYTTPVINNTTTYYAEAAFAGSNGWAGPVSPTAQGGTIGTQFTSWEVYFNVLQSTTLISIDVFPIAANEVSTLTINRSDGTVIATIPYVTSVSGGATAQTIPINVPLDPGVGYYLYTLGGSDNGLPPSGLSRNINGAVYPYTSTDIEITGNAFNNTFYMCYYRWRFNNSCASVRTPVNATITSAASISVNASPNILCIGSSTTLSVTSSNTSFAYSWTPGNISGSSITVSPTTTTKYVVNATDGSCSSKDSVVVSVVSAPSNVVSTPASVTKCSTDAPQLMSASGGITQVSMLSEDFNGTAPGWLINGQNLTPTTQWTLRPNNFAPAGIQIRSNDASQFMYSNSRGNNAVKRINLVSPEFSTSSITNATLSFYHFFEASNNPNQPDSVSVDASLTGLGVTAAGWTTLWSRRFSQGSNTSFQLISIPLPAGFLNQPKVFIRFSYHTTNNFGWAVDNVNILGNDQQMPITWSPAAGLFTDAAGTIPYSAGTGAFNVYANPSSNTTYIATATGLNGCLKRDTNIVNVRPVVSGNISGSTAVCPLGAATISVALTGTAPWSITYTDGATPVTVNGINTSPYTFVVNPAATTTYTLSSVSDAFCSAAPAALTGSAVITVNPTLFSTWLGLSSDWSDPSNWCGGVPTNLKDVVIPGALPFYPVITTTAPVARNLQINSGATLTIQASASLAIAGDVVNNGTLVNNGSVVLNGSAAQAFPGGTGTVTVMHTLEVNKPSGTATLNRKLRIGSELRPTAGAILLTDTITISSNASGTARIGAVGATASFGYSPAGRFTVERYIPTGLSHGKSWQLLAANTIGQTVRQAWQEGATGPGNNPRPGFGTTLTSNLASALALGFDFFTPNGGPSIKVYNSASNQFQGISSTNAWQIANQKGYMVFVRGDRSVNTSLQPAVPVTLRTTGRVYSPGTDAPASLPVGANRFESVGNPYASTIDFLNLLTTSTGLDTKYYVWDPTLPGSNGFGGYQTISSINGYQPTPGGTTNYPTGIPYTRIQSGQAFFVFSTSGGTVGFGESNKTAGSQQVFRNGPEARNRQFLRAYLYTQSGNLADGNVVAFDKDFSNEFESNDAIKLGNTGENFGIRSAGQLFAVEARKAVQRTDTIFYEVGNLRSNTSYRVKFVPENLHSPGMYAYLVDQFTRQRIALSLMDETELVVDITGDPASRAADRFYIVFELLRPVPVSFVNLSGIRKEQSIALNWQVENELNIRQYQVERSADGLRFETIGAVTASGESHYGFIDQEPLGGDNFYRVRAEEPDGKNSLTRVIKIRMSPAFASLLVFPNPTDGNTVGIRLLNQEAGNYQARLYSQDGGLLMSRSFQFSGGTGRVVVETGATLAAGVYRLEITSPFGRHFVRSVVVSGP